MRPHVHPQTITLAKSVDFFDCLCLGLGCVLASPGSWGKGNLKHLVCLHGLGAGERSLPKEIRTPLSEGGVLGRQEQQMLTQEGGRESHTQEGEFMGVGD